MIDIRKLKELVRLMVENDLSELDLKDQQETVMIKRPIGPMPGAAPMGVPVVYHQPAPMAAMSGVASAAANARDDDDAGGGSDDAGLHAITSPMVGTFYSAADPESPAFASVGTSVGPETTVCIVEAMKVFSEIKAECAGTIEKVLVKNGESVEFGQRLFLVRTN